jgi:hypothetical protein
LIDKQSAPSVGAVKPTNNMSVPAIGGANRNKIIEEEKKTMKSTGIKEEPGRPNEFEDDLDNLL